MKIFILGAGAVGGYFGARLAQTGVDVTFIARGEHFKALKENGIFIESVDGDFSIPKIKVLEEISEIKNPDIIIVATKTYDNPVISRELTKIVNRETVIVTIQNGIANDFELMKQVRNCAVYPGLVYLSAFKTEPGRIKHIGGLKRIVFGSRDGKLPEKLQALEKILKSADIDAILSSEIESYLWKKYIFVSAFSGMTAICRSSIGNIVKFKRTMALYENCVKEVIELAELIGVKVSDSAFEDTMQITLATNSDSKSSLLLDIEAGQKTEIETMSGTIVHLARNNNLDLPINEMIYGVISLLNE